MSGLDTRVVGWVSRYPAPRPLGIRRCGDALAGSGSVVPLRARAGRDRRHRPELRVLNDPGDGTAGAPARKLRRPGIAPHLGTAGLPGRPAAPGDGSLDDPDPGVRPDKPSVLVARRRDPHLRVGLSVLVLRPATDHRADHRVDLD